MKSDFMKYCPDVTEAANCGQNSISRFLCMSTSFNMHVIKPTNTHIFLFSSKIYSQLFVY